MINIKCPKCNTRFLADPKAMSVFDDFPHDATNVEVTNCLECSELIVQLVGYTDLIDLNDPPTEIYRNTIWPTESSSVDIPEGVPEPIAQVFREASVVEKLSANGSACLSRRCLQAILRDKYPNMSRGNLYTEIKYVVSADSPYLPSNLKDQLDYIRKMGNLAAHETRDQENDELIDVDRSDAAYLLSLLSSLMDVYYHQPAQEKLRRDLLDNKLDRAKKD